MNRSATDRSELLRIAAETLARLHEPPGDAVAMESAGAEGVGAEGARDQRDAVVNALAAALDFARLEGELLASDNAAVAESATNKPYIPSNQVLSLLQSAIEEYLAAQPAVAEGPFDPTDPGWLSVAFEKLKALFRGKATFIHHQGDVTAFREPLPADAVVALFSDWGTGEETARRVMGEIRKRNPTHTIHLGDVYYSGTEKEVEGRFLKIIKKFDGSLSASRYLALNSNHEMYSGGHAYFKMTLKQFNQAASYFNLQNQHWQLIGLDSGYEDHGLQDPQKDWLIAQLNVAGPKNILLTHHQLFSPFEKRAANRKLAQKVTPLLPKVHAWFWGHEHKAIVFGKHLGIKASCIGHGAIPGDVPYGNPTFPIPIDAIDERKAPNSTNDVIHGFALLTFSGASLQVDYVDEFGTIWHTEQL